MAATSFSISDLEQDFTLTESLILSLNTPDEAAYFQKELDQLRQALSKFLLKKSLRASKYTPCIPNRIFTRDEIDMYYNGKDNLPFYIIAQGYVFDITNVSPWNQGVFTSLQRNVNKEEYFSNYHQDILEEMIKTAPILGRLAD